MNHDSDQLCSFDYSMHGQNPPFSTIVELQITIEIITTNYLAYEMYKVIRKMFLMAHLFIIIIIKPSAH